jgi:ribosome-binding protein aMBF1 (putative translation factor)
MAKRKTLMHELHQEQARDPYFDALYQRELARFQLARQIARLRERAGLSQAALAERIGTREAAVARMERDAYRGYTVETLANIAAATKTTLEVRLTPGRRRGDRRHHTA